MALSVLGVGILVAVGLGWMALGRRSRPRCPTCLINDLCRWPDKVVAAT